MLFRSLIALVIVAALAYSWRVAEVDFGRLLRDLPKGPRYAVEIRNDALLLHRSGKGARRLAGMHELPTAEQAGLGPRDVKAARELVKRRRGITRFVITETIVVPSRAPRVEAGGELVGCGTPEALAQNPSSYTGHFLKRKLNGRVQTQNFNPTLFSAPENVS